MNLGFEVSTFSSFLTVKRNLPARLGAKLRELGETRAGQLFTRVIKVKELFAIITLWLFAATTAFAPSLFSKALILFSALLLAFFGVRELLSGRRVTFLRDFLRPSLSLAHANLFRRWANKVAVKKCEVFYFHEHISIEALRYLKRGGQRVVWDAHEFYPGATGWDKNKADRFHDLLQSVAPKIDVFIAVNSFIGELYEEIYPALPKAQVSGNNARKAPGSSYRGLLHKACGLDPSKRILLFQGGLSTGRGIQLLLESSKYLSEEWAIVFMGSGPLSELISSEVKSEVPERKASLHLIPGVSQDQLPEWTSGASIGAVLYEPINLNHRFCSPNKISEYARCGVPYLSFELPYLKMIDPDQTFGWQLPFESSAESVAKSIRAASARVVSRKSIHAREFSDVHHWGTDVASISKSISLSLTRGPIDNH